MGTLTLTKSSFWPLSVFTVRLFMIIPLSPANFMVAWSCPLPPGGIVQGTDGSLATVHPHEVVTPDRVTLAKETLVTLKVKNASVSLGLAMYSFMAESQARMESGTGTSVRFFDGTYGALF